MHHPVTPSPLNKSQPQVFHAHLCLDLLINLSTPSTASFSIWLLPQLELTYSRFEGLLNSMMGEKLRGFGIWRKLSATE